MASITGNPEPSYREGYASVGAREQHVFVLVAHVAGHHTRERAGSGSARTAAHTRASSAGNHRTRPPGDHEGPVHLGRPERADERDEFFRGSRPPTNRT
jgi:hypothetical protein